MKQFVNNPAWVGKVLADTFKTLESTVKPDWLPSLATVKRGRQGSLVATIKEYGCGVYGCVIPTMDPAVVMKLTTDDTEAQFAADLSHTLVAKICVDYHMVLETKIKHEGHTVYLLWRDSADEVGGIRHTANGAWAVHYINKQHAAAQTAWMALKSRSAHATQAVEAWADTCAEMGGQQEVPELNALGQGMHQVWKQQGIVFGDVHEGNIGKVLDEWIITDPGNVAVVDAAATTVQELHIPPPYTSWKMGTKGLRPNPAAGAGGRDVAAMILTAARQVATGPGRAHALIADIWAQFKRTGDTGGASYDEFKCEIINLYHGNQIALVELDGDISAKAAKASAVAIGRNVFHAVAVNFPGRPAPGRMTAPPTDGRRAPARPSRVGITDARFAAVVNEIARDAAPEDRFGDRKVFISKIWDIASVDPEFEDMGVDEFKQRLIAAHQGRRLIISRADLVAAMDPTLVRESETRADGATFHFVLDQTVGAGAQPSHQQSREIDDDTLRALVIRAVDEMPMSGRFGRDKVFISEVWRVISADPRIREMGLPAFKKWLVRANRDGWILMARADLVGAMDRRQVAESEIEHMGATFHFIQDRKRRNEF